MFSEVNKVVTFFEEIKNYKC